MWALMITERKISGRVGNPNPVDQPLALHLIDSHQVYNNRSNLKEH